MVSTLAAHSIERMGQPRWVVHLFLLGAAVFNAIPAITLVGAWYVMFRSPGLYNACATAILVFIHSWNEFVVALELTAKQSATVLVAIAKCAREHQTKYGEMAAGRK